jgi:hypothetical protein
MQIGTSLVINNAVYILNIVYVPVSLMLKLYGWGGGGVLALTFVIVMSE